MHLKNLSTPALVLDKEIFENNERYMEELLGSAPLKLRPHYKSHKCAAIAHRQIEKGAVGITCAKLEEAKDLAESGIEDILIANQITDKNKVSEAAHLAKACRLTVLVDDKQNIMDIEAAAAFAGSEIHILIEYEIGMKRCGVSGKEEFLSLVNLIKECPHLVFDGIQAYAGHLSHAESLSERSERSKENADKLRELIGFLKDNNVTVNTVSGGSTGTSVVKVKDDLYTELQAGSYLFMDATYDCLGLPFKPSLFILATVVSVSNRIAVVDAGVKSCGVDQGMPIPVGFTVSEVVASEEHFQLHAPSKELAVGEKVLLIPAHCCSTVNLHNHIYLIEKERVVDRITVTARGYFH
jgi:D-serine deaminase-like pyridoxal phosphate-dependent protein